MPLSCCPGDSCCCLPILSSKVWSLPSAARPLLPRHLISAEMLRCTHSGKSISPVKSATFPVSSPAGQVVPARSQLPGQGLKAAFDSSLHPFCRNPMHEHTVLTLLCDSSAVRPSWPSSLPHCSHPSLACSSALSELFQELPGLCSFCPPPPPHPLDALLKANGP